MLRTASHFPNPVVAALPVVAYPIRQPPQVLPQVEGNGAAVFIVEVDRVHHFAINVHLELLVGGVPDANRARALVAFPMAEDFLPQSFPPVDSVHRLQRPACLGSPLAEGLQPIHEPVGFVGQPHPQKRINCESGIADPATTVVPVPLPSNPLRKTGRGGGNDGPRGFVDKQFQRQSRALDHLAPTPGIVALGNPVEPIVYSLREASIGLGGGESSMPDCPWVRRSGERRFATHPR